MTDREMIDEYLSKNEVTICKESKVLGIDGYNNTVRYNNNYKNLFTNIPGINSRLFAKKEKEYKLGICAVCKKPSKLYVIDNKRGYDNPKRYTRYCNDCRHTYTKTDLIVMSKFDSIEEYYAFIEDVKYPGKHTIDELKELRKKACEVSAKYIRSIDEALRRAKIRKKENGGEEVLVHLKKRKNKDNVSVFGHTFDF